MGRMTLDDLGENCAATGIASGDAGHSLTDAVGSLSQTFHGDYRQIWESHTVQGDCRHGEGPDRGHSKIYPEMDRVKTGHPTHS